MDNKPTLLKLHNYREYVAYQYYFRMQYNGMSSDKTLMFAALTILDWLKEKSSDSVELRELLSKNSIEDLLSGNDITLDSFSFDKGFSVRVISVTEQGIWSMRLKEPDLNLIDRESVSGRSIITNVGLHIVDNTWIECGCKITVADPVEVENELEYAYRPGFVKRLFNNENVRFDRQDGKCQKINGINPLRKALSNDDGMLPNIIYTYAVGAPSVHDTFEGFMGIGEIASIMNVESYINNFDDFIPFEVDKAASHYVGYANVFLVNKDMDLVRNLQEITGQPISPGSVVVAEPRKYGNKKHFFVMDNAYDENERNIKKKRIDSLIHSYSKHKSYDFSSVVFYEDAFSLSQRLEIDRISERYSDDESRVQGLLEIIERYEEANNDLTERNNDLQRQVTEEYHRAEMYFEEQIRSDRENEDRLSSEVYDLRTQNERLVFEINRNNEGGITINRSGVDEFFRCEEYDLIISVLKDACERYKPINSRASDLLKSIVEKNELTNEGKELFEKIKGILYGNLNLSLGDYSELERLGFSVSKQGNGHYKLTFKGIDKYSFVVSATGSDRRGNRNLYSEIDNKLSVYK